MPFPKHIPSQPVDQPLIHFDRAVFDAEYADYDLDEGSSKGVPASDDPFFHGFDDEDDDAPAVKVGDFLEFSRAIVTPIDVYAFWVSLYSRQGGEVVVYDRDFETATSHTIRDGKWVALHTASRNWTLTRNSGMRIPTGYGSIGLSLLVVPSATGQDMAATSKSPQREGWEFGHTTACTFAVDENGVTRAGTNGYVARSYRDVEALRASVPHDELKARAGRAMARMFADDRPLGQAETSLID